MDGAPSFQKTVFDILKFSLVDRPRGHKQDKLNGYTVFIHFFCLCPIDLTMKLNINASKVAYCLTQSAMS